MLTKSFLTGKSRNFLFLPDSVPGPYGNTARILPILPFCLVPVYTSTTACTTGRESLTGSRIPSWLLWKKRLQILFCGGVTMPTCEKPIIPRNPAYDTATARISLTPYFARSGLRAAILPTPPLQPVVRAEPWSGRHPPHVADESLFSTRALWAQAPEATWPQPPALVPLALAQPPSPSRPSLWASPCRSR